MSKHLIRYLEHERPRSLDVEHSSWPVRVLIPIRGAEAVISFVVPRGAPHPAHTRASRPERS